MVPLMVNNMKGYVHWDEEGSRVALRDEDASFVELRDSGRELVAFVSYHVCSGAPLPSSLMC